MKGLLTINIQNAFVKELKGKNGKIYNQCILVSDNNYIQSFANEEQLNHFEQFIHSLDFSSNDELSRASEKVSIMAYFSKVKKEDGYMTTELKSFNPATITSI